MNAYREIILDYYENKCNNCGLYTNNLVIDHVYNDGEKDRGNTSKGVGNWRYYKRLWIQIELGYIDRFQLLCHSCHAYKHLSRKCRSTRGLL